MDNDPLISTALLAAASGARLMTGVSATTHVFARANLADERVAGATKVMAAGELVGDKLPGVGNRNDGGALIARVAAGAAIGAAIGAATKRDRAALALVGGVVAFLSTEATFRIRRELSRHMPAVAAALIEDVSIISIASLGAARLDETLAVRPTDASSASGAARP